jgi:SH3-like domain-containing protein
MSGLTHKIAQLFQCAIFFCVAHSAQAFEFVSVATPAILYDAPSLKAKKLFVITRYAPLEQIVTLDNWVKVRDVSGQLYWIEKRALSSKRFVVVNTSVASVRLNPAENAEVVFQAQQQLALELLGDEGGWAKVRHLDGAVGYIKITDVWGD